MQLNVFDLALTFVAQIKCMNEEPQTSIPAMGQDNRHPPHNETPHTAHENPHTTADGAGARQILIGPAVHPAVENKRMECYEDIEECRVAMAATRDNFEKNKNAACEKIRNASEKMKDYVGRKVNIIILKYNITNAVNIVQKIVSDKEHPLCLYPKHIYLLVQLYKLLEYAGKKNNELFETYLECYEDFKKNPYKIDYESKFPTLENDYHEELMSTLDRINSIHMLVSEITTIIETLMEQDYWLSLKIAYSAELSENLNIQIKILNENKFYKALGADLPLTREMMDEVDESSEEYPYINEDLKENNDKASWWSFTEIYQRASNWLFPEQKTRNFQNELNEIGSELKTLIGILERIEENCVANIEKIKTNLAYFDTVDPDNQQYKAWKQQLEEHEKEYLDCIKQKETHNRCISSLFITISVIQKKIVDSAILSCIDKELDDLKLSVKEYSTKITAFFSEMEAKNTSEQNVNLFSITEAEEPKRKTLTLKTPEETKHEDEKASKTTSRKEETTRKKIFFETINLHWIFFGAAFIAFMIALSIGISMLVSSKKSDTLV
ncbi:hypothetical protein ENBRE01_1822 [Enteropsectra breve]|nr:hypothetical protein ENBRE01_1822 [Enteropsectra breve]